MMSEGQRTEMPGHLSNTFNISNPSSTFAVLGKFHFGIHIEETYCVLVASYYLCKEFGLAGELDEIS